MRDAVFKMIADGIRSYNIPCSRVNASSSLEPADRYNHAG